MFTISRENYILNMSKENTPVLSVPSGACFNSR